MYPLCSPTDFTFNEMRLHDHARLTFDRQIVLDTFFEFTELTFLSHKLYTLIQVFNDVLVSLQSF